MIEKLASWLKQLTDNACDQAQHNGGGERNVALLAPQFKAQVSGQFAKAQLVQPRRKRADKHQHQENHNHPANHDDLQRVRPVTQRKPHGLPGRRIFGTECNHFEQLAHFVLVDEFLDHRPLAD